VEPCRVREKLMTAKPVSAQWFQPIIPATMNFLAEEAKAPALIPCKPEAECDAKKGTKRVRKEAAPKAAAAPATATTETVATADAMPKPAKKRAISKTPVAPCAEAVCANGTCAVAPPVATAVATEKEPGGESGNCMIVAKAVRMALKNSSTPMHCGADAIPALNSKVMEFINDASARAIANGRKTLKSCDF